MTDTTTTTGSAEGEAVDARYRDASLPIADRVEILLSQMTLEEKAGLFFQTMITIGEGGELAGVDPMFGTALDRGVRARPRHDPLQRARRGADRPPDGRVAQPPAGAGRDDPPRHPRHVSTDPRHSFSDNPGAAIMAGPFSQWPEAIGLAAIGDEATMDALRRHRAPRVHGRRHPRRPAPAGRPRHRAALVAPGRDVRRGPRAVGPHGRRLHPRLPGRRARPRLGRDHDEALPRRRPPAGRRGPALRLRPRAGLPGRRVRAAPQALRGRLRGGHQPDHAVLRHAGRHRVRGGRLRLQQVGHHGPPARALRLRRDRLHRLGPALRRRDHGPAVPGPRMGRRAPHDARAHAQGARRGRRPVRRRGDPRAPRRPRRAAAT